MQFTAEQVWACAAAAQRINGDYVKEPIWDLAVDQREPVTQPNKVMVKNWLRDQDYQHVTAEDHTAGAAARDHFKSYTFLAIAGRLNEFQTTAMQLAAKEQFTSRDLYDFAVISCLPSVAVRDAAHSAVRRDIYASEQLQGAEGDKIQGEVTVITARFNANYNRFKVRGRMGDSFVDFWYGLALEGTVQVRAKIKSQRGDKTTALNYVKVIG